MIISHDEFTTPRPTTLTERVPLPLLLGLTGSFIGSCLFATTYLIEGVTRPGYNAWQQAISALSLGPGGWVQQANFIIFGLILMGTTYFWRKTLVGGRGETWYPILRIIEGFSILMDGFFSQDPTGYPNGTYAATASVHGIVHLTFAFISITAMAFSFFVLARRFAGEPQWRGWAILSVFTGISIIFFITVFGISNGMRYDYAGLLERISILFATFWDIFFLARIWTGTTFMARRN